jgi:anthranilate phosphoribosyltransferase
MLLGVLGNEAGPARDIVILNAGAALYAANVAGTMKEGIDKARAVLASGAAKARLQQLISTTQQLAN